MTDIAKEREWWETEGYGGEGRRRAEKYLDEIQHLREKICELETTVENDRWERSGYSRESRTRRTSHDRQKNEPWLPEMPPTGFFADGTKYAYLYDTEQLVTRARTELTTLREKLAKEKRSTRGLRKELKEVRQELRELVTGEGSK